MESGKGVEVAGIGLSSSKVDAPGWESTTGISVSTGKRKKGMGRKTRTVPSSSSALSPVYSHPFSNPSSFSVLATPGIASSVSCKTASISIAPFSSCLRFFRAGPSSACSTPSSSAAPSAPLTSTNHPFLPLPFPFPPPLLQTHNEFEFCTPLNANVCVALTNTAESVGSPRISSLAVVAVESSSEEEEEREEASTSARRAGVRARSW